MEGAVRRYSNKADISQPDIVKTLRKMGDHVAIIGRPVDLLIRTHSTYWTAEVKTPGPNQRREMPAQIDHRKDAQSHNAPHYILMSIEDACRVHNLFSF
jgi:hypothetical protein